MRRYAYSTDMDQRLWANIMTEPNTGCWLWVGHVDYRAGYGRITVGGKVSLAHRASYTYYRGRIPRGMTLHHKCNVPCCVNPQHLEVMSFEENTRIRNSSALKTCNIIYLNRKSVTPRHDKEAGFWFFVNKSDGCWNWTGPHNGRPYGVYRKKYAHRFSYEMANGLIPDGLHIDHVCGNTLCVNPDHLEAVSEAENKRRRAISRTHCSRGHEYTTVNTHITKTGSRKCRICHALGERTRRANRGK